MAREVIGEDYWEDIVTDINANFTELYIVLYLLTADNGFYTVDSDMITADETHR